MRTVVFGSAVAMTAFAVSLSVFVWSGATAGSQGAAMATTGMEFASEADICSMTVDEGMDHSHSMLAVAEGAVAPTVSHLVFPDEKDGYNIQILTQNFTFTPASINGAVVQNEGHAHLYVNGEKITRVYGSWVHLPSSALVPGANAVSITLNANDHSEWAVDGEAVASTVIVHVAQAQDAGDM